MRSIIDRLNGGINYFGTGSQNSKEFHEFVKDFKKAFTYQLRKLKATNISISKNHFCFSGFFKVGEQWYYYSMSDVRHGYNFGRNQEPELLIRTAEHEKDYTGGANNFFTIKQGMYKDIARRFRIEIPKSKSKTKSIDEMAREIIDKGYANLYIGSNKKACRIAWRIDEILRNEKHSSTSIRTGKFGRYISYSKCETEQFSFYYSGDSKRGSYEIFDKDISDDQFLKELNLKIADKGEVIRNMFDPSIEVFLEPEAVALHDFIKGAEVLNHPSFEKALYIFRKRYPEAYMDLLD